MKAILRTGPMRLVTVFLCCCCAFFASAQYEGSYTDGLDKDHFSIIESHTPGNMVVASTIDQGGNLDIQLMEVDAAGNSVTEYVYTTSANERAFHIGYSQAGGYVIAGIIENAGVNKGLLLEVDAALNWVRDAYYTSTSTFYPNTHALHVLASTNDPIPGYLITGFKSLNYTPTGSKAVWLVKVDLNFNILWQRTLNRVSGNNDWDMASHAVEIPGQGYFFGGSVSRTNSDQVALAGKVDYAGILQWSTTYADNTGTGHNCVGADAFYDPATNEIFQLGNYTIIHHWGVAVFNAATGVQNVAKSFRVFSNLGYANIAGFRIHDGIAGSNQYFVAGYIRDASYTNTTGTTVNGSFPWAAKVEKNVPGIIADNMYPVPSSGYSASSSFFDAFSAGQQARIVYPKMGWRNNANNFMTLVAPTGATPVFETELLQVDLLSLTNPCLNTPLDFVIPATTWSLYSPLSVITHAITKSLPNLAQATIINVDNLCSSTPCDPQPAFTWVPSQPDCCIQFNGTSNSPGGVVNCLHWDFGDGNTADNTLNPVHCYGASGTYNVCFTACCFDAQGNVTTETICQPVTVQCSCVPRSDFAITSNGNCCYTLTALIPGPVDGCEMFEIFNPDGTPYGPPIPGDVATICFNADGVYQVCYTNCCVNSDGTIVYSTQCQALTVSGCEPCDVDPVFVVDDIGDCCYVFTDLTPDDPATAGNDCNAWTILDANGVLIASGTGDSFTYCFPASGTYTVCNKDCCINPDGTYTYEVYCLDIIVDCGPPCELINPDFEITVDGCTVCFQALNNGLPADPAVICADWHFDWTGDPTIGGTGLNPCYTYSSGGTYTICMHIWCCDDLTNIVEICKTITIDCCAVDPLFVVDDLGDCCFRFTDITPDNSPAGIDGCNSWTIMDSAGNIVGSSFGDVFVYCFQASGTYTICHNDCCINDDGTITVLTHCEVLTVDCGCGPLGNFDFTIAQFDDPCGEVGFCPVFDFNVDGYCATWDFGDGTIVGPFTGPDMLFCPIHTYDCSGTYHVCLTIYCCDDPSISATVCHDVIIDCGCTLPFEWFYTTTECTVCVSPIFEGPCPTDCIIWDFGDGTTASGLNPCHTYAASGTYNVCMTACCCDNFDTAGNPIDPSECITICHQVTVDCCDADPTFIIDDLGDCCYRFTDLTPDNMGGIPGCNYWTIVDANGTVVASSFGDFFIHCFTASGTYTICNHDCCINSDGTVTTEVYCLTITVDCGCGPAGNFDFEIFPFDDPCGEVGFCPVFDFDVNGYCATWDFGDGTTAGPFTGPDMLFCPVHTYDCSGTYHVCLTIYCCDDPTFSVTVCHDVVIDCGCTLPFEWFYNVDACTVCVSPIFEGPCPTDCIFWDFGDGTTATGLNPCHTYTGSGTYTICMTACCCDNLDAAGNPIDPNECTTICKVVTVDCGGCCYPIDFAYTVDACTVCVSPIFDPSCQTPSNVYFDYGDGSPLTTALCHTYTGSGTYLVCMYAECPGIPPVGITCHQVTVNCCTVPDFDWDILFNENCEIGACISTPLDPDQYCATWNWGDGVIENYPVNVCPTHEYPCPGGAYVICVTVYCCNADPAVPGASVTVCKDVTVNCCKLPSAAFIVSEINGCTVNFGLGSTDDYCGNICVSWNFGDGTTVNGSWSETHTYSGSGTYLVCATLYCCDDPSVVLTVCTEVTVNCCCDNFDFTWNVLDDCNTVQFFGPGCEPFNGPIWWTFGDGTTGYGPDPVHTFPGPGIYHVCLHICCINSDGTVTNLEVCHDIEIVPCGCITDAEFGWEFFTDASGQCCVSFYDLTPEGNPYGCESWVFDTIVSILQGDNILFCFESSGWYTVCHYDCCVDAAGNTYYDEYCVDIYVDCGNPCIDPTVIDPNVMCAQIYEPVCGCDGVTYYNDCDAYYHNGVTSWTPGPCPGQCCPPSGMGFEDLGNCCFNFFPEYFMTDCDPTGNVYMWDFGDGTTSNQPNPQHCYTSSGTYIVCVTVICPDGTISISYCEELTVNCPCDLPCDVHAAFNQTIQEYNVTFSDNSHAGPGTTITGYFWTFGDGNFSTSANPVHSYAHAGDYMVCLTVTGVNTDGLACEDTYCYPISVTCIGDITYDGVVNISDLLLMMGAWGVCP